MALKDISLGAVDGADFVLTYDDVTNHPQSVRINGLRNRSFTFTLLDYATEAPTFSKTFAPGDGSFALPANVRNGITVTFHTVTRPFDGAVFQTLDSPKYRIDIA